MVDRLLRVHIQSQRAFGPLWTLSYNKFFIQKVLDVDREYMFMRA